MTAQDRTKRKADSKELCYPYIQWGHKAWDAGDCKVIKLDMPKSSHFMHVGLHCEIQTYKTEQQHSQLNGISISVPL